MRGLSRTMEQYKHNGVCNEAFVGSAPARRVPRSTNNFYPSFPHRSIFAIRSDFSISLFFAEKFIYFFTLAAPFILRTLQCQNNARQANDLGPFCSETKVSLPNSIVRSAEPFRFENGYEQWSQESQRKLLAYFLGQVSLFLSNNFRFRFPNPSSLPC